MDEASRFRAESTALFAVRVISNCLLVVSFDAAFGILFKLSPILICISSCEMLIYLALAMLLRRKFRSFIVFGLVHLSGILLVTYGAPYMFYVHLIEASWISAFSLYDYISGRRMLYPGIGHIIYPFFIFIAGFTTGERSVTALALIAETAFLILFMLRRNLMSLDNVIVTSSKYVRVPYGKMKRMNSYLAVFFVLTSIAVAVVLGLVFDGKDLIALIGNGMLLIMAGIFVGIVWLFSHLFPNMDSGLAERMAGGGNAFNEVMEQHPILMMLWHLFEMAIYVITIAVFVYLAWRFLRDLYYEFRAAVPENGDRRVHLETREKADETERKTTTRPGLGQKDRVRRKYIRLVRESGRQGELSQSMTPKEIEEKIGREDLANLHDAYEKARYG